MSAFVKSVSISKNILVSLTTIIMTILVAACSGGGGGGSSNLSTAVQVLSGGAVDGPVTNATVTLYKINYGANVTVGDVVSTGTTNSKAAIQGLTISSLPDAPYAYILEFTANANTLDLTSCTDPANPTNATCKAPIIGTMRTVVTDEMLSKGENIYATPLTSMATNVALTNAVGSTTDATYDLDKSNDISVTEFKAALKTAALQVTSMLGFGLSSEVDIFNTPPLVDSTTDTTAEQQDTADYRAAITSIAAVVNQMEGQVGGDAAAVFKELTNDMADGNIDGKIDGVASEVFSDTTLTVLDQDPTKLPIPNDPNGKTIADIEQVLADETTATGSTTDTTSLTDGSVVAETAPAETNPDIDDDGKLNSEDAYPSNPLMDTDTDGDGAPDDVYQSSGADANGDGVNDRADPNVIDTTAISDNDDDDDGWTDATDDYPKDKTRHINPDLDRDSDTVLNGVDNCPFNANTNQLDTDNNGQGDACSNDADGDGILNDGTDNCPLIANPDQTDTDNDTTGDACDTDIDGDNVLNAADAFPLDSAESVDTDKDGIGNNADTDDDDDKVLDVNEAGDANGFTNCSLKADCDGDGYFDNVDLNDTDASITINTAPKANDVAVSTNEDVQASGTLSATDANTADTLTYSLVASSDVNGTATLTNATSGAFTFDPTANFSGTASFKYLATDNATTPAKSNTATVTITVNAVNDAPVANAGTLAATEDTTATGTLAGSDTEGSAITFAVAANAANGTVTVTNAATGAYSYAPNANFNGSDSFTFVANDGTVDSATATVTVTVSAVNDVPVANAGTLAATEDTTATGTLSGSDTEGSSLTFAIVANATNGTVTITNASTGAYSYAPNANFTGTDSFTFVANDGALSSTVATITITVNAVNDAPVANAGTLAATEDATATGTLSGSDTEGSSLTFAIASNATNGTVTITNASTGAYSYAPNANFNGSDSFTFTANDGALSSTAATVTITVNAVNDAPVANAGTLAATEDTTATGTLSGSDTEGSSLTFAIASNATNGTVTITNASTGAYSYAPNANFNGSDSFTFTANDGTIDSVVATITITVGAVNDAPVANAGTLAATEDTTATGTLSGSDTEDSSLTFAIAANATNGTVTITNASTGAYSYAPNANFNGSDSFTFTANDGALSSTAATITITVNAVNDAPVANTGTLAATEDTTATGILAGSDTEGSALTFAVAANATNGTVTVTNAATGAYSYAPNTNFNGSDSFTFTANDGALSSTAATITITVNAVNDAPVAVNDTAGVQPNNSVVINVLGNDTDNDTGDTKSVISVGAVSGTAGGTVAVTNSGADVTYTASTGEGEATFTYTMQDAAAVQSTATVTVTVTANPSPVASAGTLTVDEDSSNNTGTVSATDADPITYSIATAASNGTVTITDVNTGAYTYTPNANFAGTDSFTFIANDGISDSAPATVTITVTAANDIPVATAGTLTTAEDTTVTGTVAGTDIDGDGLTFAVNTNATNGVVTITDAATGAYSYVPNANFNGSDSFTFVANDGTIDSTPATVTITVSAVNDAPVATAGTLTTAQDTTATGTVAGTDVDGDSLTFTVNTNATNGVVTITDAATGAYSYVPNASFNGSDSFTFVANDGTVDSAPATVTITVTASTTTTVDISGIWKMDITVASATPIGGGSCDSVVGDAASIYITNAQSGSTVTVIAEEGQTMTGTVDTAGLGTLTGTFTATEPDLSQPTVDGATNTFSLDISFTTTSATTAGNMAGTLTLVDSFNGTQECTVVHNMTASYVYKQTGSENYNGVYAIELSENREENFGSGNQFNEGQDGLTAQFIFDAGADADGNVQLILPPGAGGTVTSSTYDPVTGFFSFALEELAEEDWDGDGVIDDYLVITDNLSGITVRDSASSGGNGAPHLKIQGRNTTRYYSDSAHTNQKGVARAESNIYGKLLVTNGYTRTALVTMSDGSTESRINVGLLNAPLQNAGGNLYLQVMDSSGIAELCNAPYLETTDGAGDGRYSMNINMPHPDIQAENFRSGTFVGNVNCNTNATNGSEQVASGDVLPVSIIDAGVDGLIDSVSGGSDDTVVFSTTVTATPVVNTNGTDRYITAITRNNINVSGAKSSATMLGGSVPLFGYFDYSEDINVSFPVHTEGADKYQIRVQEGYAKHRFTTTGTAVTILAGSLPSQNMRLVAMKDDASGARAMSFSRRIQMQEGIRGFFNIELGDGVDENILQVYLDADMNGNVTWGHVTSNVSNFFCELVEIDRNTDVVTLTMSDTNGLVTGTSGAFFDLKLNFKSTGTVTSNYAVVTSAAVPAIVNASARAVNSEMLMRTFVSDAGVEETSITMANAFDATNTYDDATFKASSGNLIVGGVDNLVTGKKMWTTGAGNTFLDKVKRFNGMPFDDGQPQFSGQYVTKKTGSTSWNLGSGLLAAGDYKIVTKDSATGLKTLNFATTYSAPSASAYVAPSLGDMTISVPLGAGDTVCSIGTACDSTTPVDVAANNGTWAITFTGAAPTGSLWQLILTEQMAFQEYRSPLMDPTVADSGIVNNDDGTYTLTNNGILFPTGDGIVVKVQVRVMDQKGKASTIIGQTRGGQAAYMTVP